MQAGKPATKEKVMIRLLTISDRTFGVELEMMLSTGVAMRALHEAGIPMEGTGRWIVKTDGSLPSGGCEVVSPILRGREGLQQVAKACIALKRAGATVNTRCGLHVHHGCADFVPMDVKNVVKRYAKAEKCIAQLIAPSRVTNSYCSRLAPTGDLEALFRRVDGCGNRIDRTVTAVCGSSRYWVVNLQSIRRHSTVEFRQHQGTINARKVVAWIIFTQCLMEGAKQDTIQGRVLSPRHLKMETLLKMRGIRAGHRAFYLDRASYLAEQVQAREDRRQARLAARQERAAQRAAERDSARVRGTQRPEAGMGEGATA